MQSVSQTLSKRADEEPLERQKYIHCLGMLQNKSCALFAGIATPADVFDPHASYPCVRAYIPVAGSLQAIAHVLS